MATVIGTLLFVGITALYTGEAVFYASLNNFATWADFVRVEELGGVADQAIDMIPAYTPLFLIPLLLFLGYWFLKKMKMIEIEFTVPTNIEKKVLLVFLSVSLLFVGFNYKYVTIDSDTNKKQFKNSKSYIQNYGLMNMMFYHTYKKFVLDNIGIKDVEVELDDFVSEVDYVPDQNKMTNKHKGKNLIFVVGESVAPYAITKEVTPTLYKMKQESVDFTEYYSLRPNTLNSEFAMLNSFYMTSEKETANFISDDTMPTLFKELGYSANAYHNYHESFYNRIQRHVDLGFDAMYGYDNLKLSGDKYIFGPNEKQLFEKTLPLFENEEQFFSYFLSVSTHAVYNDKERFDFADPIYMKAHEKAKALYPTYSEGPLGYVSSAAVLDDGMTYLMEELENKQMLDNTVIVFVGDHYPYGLSDEEILTDFGVSGLDIYKVPFFIWEKDGKSEVNTSVMGNVDILPTLANMFGLPLKYAMGRDVYNRNSNGLLEWYDWRAFSFITDDGGYDGNTEQYFGNVNENNLQSYMDYLYKREELNDYQFKLYQEENTTANEATSETIDETEA